jgi:hypothetical protein
LNDFRQRHRPDGRSDQGRSRQEHRVRPPGRAAARKGRSAKRRGGLQEGHRDRPDLPARPAGSGRLLSVYRARAAEGRRGAQETLALDASDLTANRALALVYLASNRAKRPNRT